MTKGSRVAVLFAWGYMNEPFYKTKKWQSKREKILRRDGYMCQECKRYGKARQAVVVHHAFPREWYPQYEWEDWNLISLCNKCHENMHDRDTHELTKIGRALRERVRRRMPPRVVPVYKPYRRPGGGVFSNSESG